MQGRHADLRANLNLLRVIGRLHRKVKYERPHSLHHSIKCERPHIPYIIVVSPRQVATTSRGRRSADVEDFVAAVALV